MEKEENEIKTYIENLRKAEKEKSIILDALSEHVIYYDTDQNIIWANKVACDSLNLSKEKIIGQKCFVLWQNSNTPCKGCPVLIAVRTGQPESSEMSTPDGKTWLVKGYPIFNDNNIIYGMVEITQDITERKEADRKIKKSEEKFREAYIRAEFYKDLFAHDMNNILQSILSATELCEIYLDKLNHLGEVKKDIDLVQDQVSRGTTLISNIRKLSQLEEIETSTHQTGVYNILKDSITFIKQMFQDKKINIQLDFPPNDVSIQANEFLHDVFTNILINAVKYNKQSIIEIMIRISKSQEDDTDYIKMEFIDNGVGIEDDRKKTIFQRRHKRDKDKIGMGIGLSLVKEIIEKYSGIIWVENRVSDDYSKGCNFIILIPEMI